MPRIPRGQDAPHEGAAPEERPADAQAPPEAPTQQMSPVEPGGDAASAPAPAIPAPEGATVVAPADPPGDAGAASAATAEEQPATADAHDPRPGFRARTRMRRRLRYLRRLRELAFRDLGGLVFDLHRFGRERGDLVQGKLDALAAIDAELRTLETALRDHREYTDLREAGVAACPRCGAIHDTDASFCPGCGTALKRSVVQDAAPVSVAPAEGAPDGTAPQASGEQQAQRAETPSS